MAYNNPAVADFKNFFVRDFPYGGVTTDPTLVSDNDIANAFLQANVVISQSNFTTQPAYTQAYLQLAAHYLTITLRNSAAGISGAFSFLTSSKSVGSVSQSFAIPDAFANNPYYAALMSTSYGANYLINLLPLLVGQVFSVYGDANY